MKEALTFREFIDTKNNWQEQIGTIKNWQQASERLMEENIEYWEALHALQAKDTPEARRELAMEFVDMIIVGTSLIHFLGYDLEELTIEKMDIIMDKYDLEENRKLQEKGVHPHMAVRIQKQAWEQKQQGVIYQAPPLCGDD